MLYIRLSMLVLAVLTVACASTRLQPMGAAPGTFKPEGDEARLWDDARGLQRRIDDSIGVYPDSALQAYVTSVAQRVAAASFSGGAVTPQVRILIHPLLNAFALPHGTIYVHSGMLARMDNESQLATVLGHELTHITNRHTIRELRAARNKRTFTKILSGVTMVAGAATLGAGAGSALGSLSESLGNLWTLSAVSGYSRELESEADHAGLEAMMQAGYDPCEAPKVFEHMLQAPDLPNVPETYFYSTHPRLQVRLGNYLNLLGRRCSRSAADSAPSRADDYRERMAMLVLDNAELDLQIGRINTAEAGLERHLELRPASPRGHFLRGELHRRRFRTAQAIAAYERAASLDTLYADPHRELGLLYRELDRRPEARGELRRYLDLKPDAADAASIKEHLATLGGSKES